MRTIVLTAVWMIAALSACASAKATGPDELPTMTVDEVDAAIAAGGITPVDCNGERTRHKKGVLPGAIAITDEETFAASELPADKGTKLVFYCADPG